jgi:hypothetical protein
MRAMAAWLPRLSLLALLLAGAAVPARAPVGEYELKAAFVYNFIAFARWPEETDRTLTLCIHGPDPFGAMLDKLQRRTVGKRGLAVRRAVGLDELADCDAVFIAAPALGGLGQLLERLGNRPVLTIADSPGAMRRGVVVNMNKSEQGKVSFEVNLGAARARGLGFSAQMLSLATEVRY